MRQIDRKRADTRSVHAYVHLPRFKPWGWLRKPPSMRAPWRWAQHAMIDTPCAVEAPGCMAWIRSMSLSRSREA